MGLSERPVLVRVPATSANLGPGFDTLGLALALYDEVEARVTDSGVKIEVTGEGAAEVAGAGEKHLIVRAMRVAFDELGVDQPTGLALRCVNRIPHGRGLGSSAAAIVAGLLAARALAGAPVAPADVLPLASTLEGHPDNVAPCLYGGLTIAWVSAGAPFPEPSFHLPAARAVRLEPLSRLRPVVFVTPQPVSTKVARGLLPPAVPHADAARNAGRAALLVAVLAGLPSGPALAGPELASMLLDATEDKLHQDYRALAMPDTLDLVARLRAAGVPAVVSGAGPSVLALLAEDSGGVPEPNGAPEPNAIPELVGEHLNRLGSIAAETGTQWRISPLGVERRGASVAPDVSRAR
jgi:homoserine kinase